MVRKLVVGLSVREGSTSIECIHHEEVLTDCNISTSFLESPSDEKPREMLYDDFCKPDIQMVNLGEVISSMYILDEHNADHYFDILKTGLLRHMNIQAANVEYMITVLRKELGMEL